MGHLVGVTQLLHSSSAVAAADDGDGGSLAQSLGHSLGALGEGGELKHAHGAIPDDGTRVGHGVAVQLHGLGTNVQALPAIGDLTGLDHLTVGVGRESVGADGIHGQQQLYALGLGLLDHILGVVHPVGFQQAVAHLAAHGGREGVGHAAADDDGVGDLQQVVDDADLAGHLAAAQDGHQGALGAGNGAAQELQLLLDQEARHGGQIGGHAGGGGVGTVDRAEGVGHVQIRHGSHGLRQLGVVLGLTLFKAGVLQQQDLAGLQRGSLGLRILTDNILGKDDLLAQQLAQALGDGSQSQLLQGFLPVLFFDGRCVLTLFHLLFHIGLKGGHGLAQVRAGDDGGAVLQQIPDGGQGGDNALVAGDLAGLLVLGNVEIAAQQDLLAGYLHVTDGLLVVIHVDFLHRYKIS